MNFSVNKLPIPVTTEVLKRKDMASSLKGLAGGPEATGVLFLVACAGAGGTIFPSSFLKNKTVNATEYSVYTNPRPVTKRTFATSIPDPTLGAKGSMANPGTKNTGSHLVRRVVPGVRYSNIAFPFPGAMASANTKKANRIPHPPSCAGNLIPASTKNLLTIRSMIVKTTVPVTASSKIAGLDEAGAASTFPPRGVDSTTAAAAWCFRCRSCDDCWRSECWGNDSGVRMADARATNSNRSAANVLEHVLDIV
mmetsp:Transcript_28933/g.78388  ORF Transcript_28933/g.78388 Transcript_28933/m.78388 type:complete len:252 (-) Transcript_28933:219-974(-)